MDMDAQVWFYAVCDKHKLELADYSVTFISFLYENAREFEDNLKVINLLHKSWTTGQTVERLHNKMGLQAL